MEGITSQCFILSLLLGYGGGYQGYNNPAAVPGYTAPAQPPPPQGPYVSLTQPTYIPNNSVQ